MRKALLPRLTAVAIAAAVAACAPSRQEQAESIYGKAAQAFADKKMGQARSLLDSLRNHYADQPLALREGRDLLRLVNRYEAERTIAFLDSSLALCEATQRRLTKEMAAENPDAAVPTYMAKTQQAWRTFARCLLKARTDANGVFSLSSNYVGEAAIHHDHIVLRSGEQYLTTDKVADGANSNTFRDDEHVWETLRYDGAEAANIAKFIVQNFEERIVVDYRGPRTHFASYMTDTDKTAIRQVWELSLALREGRKIRSMIRSARIEMSRSEG